MIGPMSSCTRETEVLELALIGQWPARANADLRAHVEACALCRDVALVAGAVADDRDQVVPVPQLPDPALLWFRAERRAREEAARRAGLPLLIVPAAMVVAAVVVVARVVGSLDGAWDLITSGAAAALADTIAWFARPADWWAGTSATVRWTVIASLACWMLSVPVAVLLSRWADRSPDSAVGSR